MEPEVFKAISTFTMIAMWTAILPLIVGLGRAFRSNWGWKVMIIYFTISLITDNISTYLPGDSEAAKYIPRIFTLIEFSLITLFFISITSRKAIRITMAILIIPFTCVTVLDFFLGGIMKRDDLSLGVESLVFISYSVTTLFFMLKDAEYTRILSRGEFWMVSSILLYFGGNIFVFITTNYMSTISVANGVLLWTLHGILCVIFYLISSVGLWKAKEYR